MTSLDRTACATAIVLALLASRAVGQEIEWISVASDGRPSMSASASEYVISGDGRCVAFISHDPNYVPGSGGALSAGFFNAFVRDRQAGVTSRIGLGVGGAPNNGSVFPYAMSHDGNFVVFSSSATNLHPLDTDALFDLFLLDRASGALTLLSVSTAGTKGNANTGYENDTFGFKSHSVGLSADHLRVAFDSQASNLVAGDLNGTTDVFLRDLASGTTTRISAGVGGAEANSWSQLPTLSADGRFVAFLSRASNLVAGDTNGFDDVFIADTLAATVSRVSLGVGGAQSDGGASNPFLCADGSSLYFESTASNLIAGPTSNSRDSFVRTLATGVNELVSLGVQGNVGNWYVEHHDGVNSLSADGRFALFRSFATNMVPVDVNGTAPDLFLRDRLLGTTRLISVDQSGNQLKLSTVTWAGLDAAGSSVSFSYQEPWGNASPAVMGDSNGGQDAFVNHRAPSCGPAPTTYCTPKVFSNGCSLRFSTSGEPQLSGGADAFHVVGLGAPKKVATLIWSLTQASTPFGGGTLCLGAPIARTPGQQGQNLNHPPPNLCARTLSFHFTQAYMSANGLQAGDIVNCQWWARDNGYPAPDSIALSDGMSFTICP